MVCGGSLWVGHSGAMGCAGDAVRLVAASLGEGGTCATHAVGPSWSIVLNGGEGWGGGGLGSLPTSLLLGWVHACCSWCRRALLQGWLEATGTPGAEDKQGALAEEQNSQEERGEWREASH